MQAASAAASRSAGPGSSSPVSAEPSKAILLVWLAIVAAPPGWFSPWTR